MDYETCPSGITLRGIRRAFRDELNRNPAIRACFDRACGGGMIEAYDGAVMKNQGDDLRFVTRTARATHGVVLVNVQLDRVLGPRPVRGVVDFTSKPKVRTDFHGDSRRITAAPSIWFNHTSNAERATNPLHFESMLTVASPKFVTALEWGIRRAQASFGRMTRPAQPLPPWAKVRRDFSLY